ncbi:glycosyltransferase family 1 protein, partial [bacterium]|nr:glycosyltransferase family 1 protein [bacterium]
PITRAVQKFFVENSAKRVTRVITISEFTRGDIIKRLGIPGEKIDAILLAPKEMEARHQASWDELILKHRINRPYVFVLSSKSPHKNIPRLVEAFLRANHKLEHAYQLIIGGHLPDRAGIARQIKTVVDESSDIRVTGYISDDELVELLAHATVYVFPSLYEGFGLPALEAMAVGVPVTSSDRASLPEVCGDAAIYIDPTDIEAMAASLVNVMSDSELRARLIAAGYENLKRFSWDTAARQTLAVYQSLS